MLRIEGNVLMNRPGTIPANVEVTVHFVVNAGGVTIRDCVILGESGA
ncbi:hypothetical protein [Cellulomonas sp. URHB0016]